MDEKDFKYVVRNTLNDKSSRAFVVELLKISRPDAISPTGKPYAEGSRFVGQTVLDWILKYSPEKYLEIIQEMKG